MESRDKKSSDEQEQTDVEKEKDGSNDIKPLRPEGN
jgi:hypothetical protein